MELLKTKEVVVKLKTSISNFNQVVKHQPDFPRPIKLTPKAHPMWRDIDIDAYLERKAA